jgi:hypothetical protein
VERKYTFTFTSPEAWAPKKGNLAAKPCPTPGSGPFVLDGINKLHPPGLHIWHENLGTCTAPTLQLRQLPFFSADNAAHISW